MSQICSTCGNTAISLMSPYFDKDGMYIGEWPLYFFGAGPHNPMDATEFFCNPSCVHTFKHNKHNLET